MTDPLHAELTAFLDTYFEAWGRYDVPAMRALWDEAEPTPIYLAEESEPRIGWAAILAYWNVDRSASQRLLSWRDLTAVRGGADTAIAFYHAHWSTYIPGNRLYPKPFGGPVRISMALRRKAEGWRAFHYIEAPLASLVQLRKAHEDAVDPALHERLRGMGITY
jgi:hypothetical protein